MEEHERGGANRSASAPLAPLGYRLQSARTTLRFASSKLSLASNPLAPHSDSEENREEEEEEEQHLIGSQNQHHSDPDSPHKKEHPPSKQKPKKERPLSVYPEEPEEQPLRFAKRHSASTSELFYDLWFVANLTVFATVHPITDRKNLYSFIGYFLLLWITWLMTTVFDARFGQDGVLERVARACHLGVMMGFAVVAVVFNESELIEPIFRATCYFLMFSRLVLAAQYGLVAFHVRKFRHGKLVLTSAIALHLIPAIVYLVLALVIPRHQDRHLVWVWYGVGLAEMLAVLVHATISKTLSFSGTHFNERLNLLTLIVLGEGVIILSKNVTKIVEYTYVKGEIHEWSPALVGIIVCSASILYITFQLYFDWMHHHNHMHVVKQAVWTAIHLPFHIALVLLSEGSSQWGLWWRAMEAFKSAEKYIRKATQEAIDDEGESDAVAEAMEEAVMSLFKKYGADTHEGGEEMESLGEAVGAIKSLPNSFWSDDGASSSLTEKFMRGYETAISTTINAISDAFGLHYEKKEEGGEGGKSASLLDAELAALRETTDRLVLVFIYMFMAAGAVLTILMIMHLLSKRRGWSVFNIMRTVIVKLIGLGLAFVSLLAVNRDLVGRFLETPWQLPTITICFAFVLVLTHLPHPPRIIFKHEEPADTELGQVPGGHGPAMGETEYKSPVVGAEGQPPAQLSRAKTFRRGLTTVQRAARNIRIEPGRYEPVSGGHADDDAHERRYSGGPGILINGHTLYSV